MLYRFDSSKRGEIAVAFVRYAAARVLWPASYNDLYAAFRQAFNLGCDQGNDLYADIAYRFYSSFHKCLRYHVLRYTDKLSYLTKNQVTANSRVFILDASWKDKLNLLQKATADK